MINNNGSSLIDKAISFTWDLFCNLLRQSLNELKKDVIAN